MPSLPRPVTPVAVAFLPSEANGSGGQVCIVVDVLRASSTMVVLFGRGCSTIRLARQVVDARRVARGGVAHLFLCGEDASGRRARGFQASPSPHRLEQVDLKGRSVVLYTTNGTAATFAARAAGARGVLVGSLLNARACVEQAAAEARRWACGITIVCAGREKNASIALDDAYCAGYMVAQLLDLDGKSRRFALHDSAVVAHKLLGAFASPMDALRASSSGRVVTAIGDEDDIAYCSRVDTSEIVPRLGGGRWPILLAEAGTVSANGKGPARVKAR